LGRSEPFQILCLVYFVRLWVISRQTHQGLNPTVVRFGPKADISH
jgi:hypothetical protein